MSGSDVVWLASATLISGFMTWWVRGYSLSRGVLDIPNARSSHVQPVPRGGGLAIIVAVLLMLVTLGLSGAMETRVVAVGLGASGLPVGLIGYLDDRRNVAAPYRMLVHAAAAVCVVTLIWMASRKEGAELYTASWVILFPVLVLGVAWGTNLFNFMDGIDGIAASQALFISISSILLINVAAKDAGGWCSLLAATAGASVGFLYWNWPPAKIFMGDAGSGFLGFWLAALAVSMHAFGILNIWTSIILNALFISDASVTLVRRMMAGERWYDAHRSHAYQLLARRWDSHLRVIGVAWLINIALVLPAGMASVLWEEWALPIALFVVASLSVGCALLGAGRTKSGSSDQQAQFRTESRK